jgi:hypothetical protein
VTDLARRAVACRGWRWMPGMLALHPELHPGLRLVNIEDAGNALQENGWLPDLTDAATLGVLLRQVREAHAGYIVISEGRGWWSVETEDSRWDNDNTASLVEALVAALEAAKEKP